MGCYNFHYIQDFFLDYHFLLLTFPVCCQFSNSINLVIFLPYFQFRIFVSVVLVFALVLVLVLARENLTACQQDVFAQQTNCSKSVNKL